jgi:type IV secretory pathway TrbF-like protein
MLKLSINNANNYKKVIKTNKKVQKMTFKEHLKDFSFRLAFGLGMHKNTAFEDNLNAQVQDEIFKHITNANSTDMTKNYLDQQTESIIKQNILLKRFAAASSVVIIALIAGCIYLGSLPKKEPYIVMVDKATGKNLEAIKMSKDLSPNESKAIREKDIADTLENLLAVSPDNAVLDAKQLNAKNFILSNSFAENFLHEHFTHKENDPYELNKKYIVMPQVTNMMPATYAGESPNAYDFEVESKWYDRKGNFVYTDTVKGSLVYEIVDTKDAIQLRNNPLGTYITKLVWQNKINKDTATPVNK